MWKYEIAYPNFTKVYKSFLKSKILFKQIMDKVKGN